MKRSAIGRSAGAAPVDSRLRIRRIEARANPDGFASVVRSGLTATPKHLPCRYFYDEKGSALFERICDLPEYYLTRAEREIFQARAGEIVGAQPGIATLAELGSGSASKTRVLIEALLARRKRLRYVPVDIAAPMLESSSRELLTDFPGLRIVGIAAEYRSGLRALARERTGAMLLLWLGSNVGNLDRAEAAAFLRLAARALRPADRLLLGVDLRKDRRTLEAAYDDAAGVTARFNLNLLDRINRELGGRFDLARFRHRAVYDEVHGRVEMYLVSERAQTVEIAALGLRVSFRKGEAIHTENSYKYSIEELDALAKSARLTVVRRWFDAERRFCEVLLAPAATRTSPPRTGKAGSRPGRRTSRA